MADFFPLLTDRLCLRAFRAEDLSAFTRYRNQPEVARYQSWSSFTAEDARRFWQGQQDLAFNRDDSWFQIALARREDDVLLGDIAVHFFDNGQQAELGFTLDSDHQQQGYAREALDCVLDLLFARLDKHRLSAIIDTRNEAARKLLEKSGFRREAHYRENIHFKGSWSDEYGYALLQSEWRQARGRSG
ncbi:GNAT family protein [Kiloniella laminariae]|uniref:GNAT family protein n=1 Tax=Kiloniella laminariae TaxID=454162 RepID=A0ABT4LF75_9PROT|nr:GNAT family protein [Kiloniella laminariae]MCZ4279755.1 GNAT family protein [Kiloniella laminariae]